MADHGDDLGRATRKSVHARALERVELVVLTVWLGLMNRMSRRSVTGVGPAVSLTTYGTRAASAHLAIESIGRGRLRPSRLVLWVDDPALFEAPPASLARLQRRGLEVCLSQNFGPHTKYFPYVSDTSHDDAAFVTSDDDILYPSTWLAELATASASDPSVVHAHRAHEVVVAGATIAPYMSWRRCRTTAPSLRHFGTGVSGVIYPPEAILALRSAGDEFLEKCPSADDVWIHWVLQRSGIPTAQIRDTPSDFLVIRSMQDGALSKVNNAMNANDTYLQRLHDASDVERLTTS